MDERLKLYFEEFGEDSWQRHLALHAAFPIAFTADLLLKLLVNFPLIKDGKPLILKNHHLIASDLILSPLCFDIGQGIFEFHPEIREELHDKLMQKHSSSLYKLANFLRFYIEENPTQSPTEVYRNAQRFEAAKIIDQNLAAAFILSSLKNQRNQNKGHLKGIEIQLKKAKELRNKIGGRQRQDFLLLDRVEDLVKSIQQLIDGNTEAARATIERIGLSEGKRDGSFETAVPREVLEMVAELGASKSTFNRGQIPRIQADLSVFLCYAKEDTEIARKMYDGLSDHGINVWFDEESLMVGDNWEKEIHRAIRESDYFIVLMSRKSVSRIGYLNREIRLALDTYRNRPPGETYIIPALTEACESSFEELNELHSVKLFPDFDEGMNDLLMSMGETGLPHEEFNQYLTEALDSYSMNRYGDEISLLYRRFDEIKQMLEKHYGDKIYSPVKNGAIEKRTDVNLEFELDIVVPFKKGYYTTLKSMFNDLHEFLRSKSIEGKFMVRRQTVSLGIKYLYDGGKHSMDIVPGMEINLGEYPKTEELNLFVNKPKKHNNKHYIKACPKRMMQIIKFSHSDVHNVIRLLKAWKYKRDVPIGSFLLELLVVEAFHRSKKTKGLWCQLKMTLEFIHDNIQIIKLRAPGNPSNIITDSLESHKKVEIVHRIKNMLNKLAEDERRGRVDLIRDYFPFGSVNPQLDKTPKLIYIEGGTYYRGCYFQIPLSLENYPKLLKQKLATSISWKNKDEEEQTIAEGTTITKKLLEQLQDAKIKYIRIQDPQAYSWELPVHQVAVDSFALGKYPVTFAEYDAFCEATKRQIPKDRGWGRDQRPVTNVSWFDAIAYCNWLSDLWGYERVYKRTGNEVDINYKANGYRLPTEAEWEFAARGGKKSKGFLYSGSNNLDEVGWYDANSGDKTHEVGQKKPNELGLYDMSGNVWEWCNDWWDAKFYGKINDSNFSITTGPKNGSARVYRGGSWIRKARYCRVAYRYWFGLGYGGGKIGFRLARS